MLWVLSQTQHMIGNEFHKLALALRYPRAIAGGKCYIVHLYGAVLRMLSILRTLRNTPPVSYLLADDVYSHHHCRDFVR